MLQHIAMVDFSVLTYSGTGKSASGMAGTFKSTSGWTDGKYYALMNGIAVGTIIRVTGTNGKTIYAKVLGQLPEMKESNGLAGSDQQCCICRTRSRRRKISCRRKY